MTKLYITRGPESLRRKNFWTNDPTNAALATISERYKEILGRDVSVTLVVRRALEVLSKHLKKVDHDIELAALMRHVR
jgi:hypothetical protein